MPTEDERLSNPHGRRSLDTLLGIPVEDEGGTIIGLVVILAVEGEPLALENLAVVAVRPTPGDKGNDRVNILDLSVFRPAFGFAPLRFEANGRFASFQSRSYYRSPGWN